MSRAYFKIALFVMLIDIGRKWSQDTCLINTDWKLTFNMLRSRQSDQLKSETRLYGTQYQQL